MMLNQKNTVIATRKEVPGKKWRQGLNFQVSDKF